MSRHHKRPPLVDRTPARLIGATLPIAAASRSDLVHKVHACPRCWTTRVQMHQDRFLVCSTCGEFCARCGLQTCGCWADRRR